MARHPKSSSEWTQKAVVERLRAKTAGGRSASAQVFMSDAVAAEDLSAKAKEIVETANASLGLAPGTVRVGRVHRLAKSFSVTSDQPEIFANIASRYEVKSLLDSEQTDILPKPV
ncbi:hypothetical protein BH10PSE6_BH10PSE6_25790 [soil metagenome]